LPDGQLFSKELNRAIHDALATLDQRSQRWIKTKGWFLP